MSWTSTLCRSIVCRLTSTAVAKTMGAAVISVCPTQGAPPAPAPLASGCREMAEPVTQVGPCLGYCAFIIIVFMGCRCLPNAEGTSCTCPTSLDSTACDTGGPCLGYCVCIMVIVFMGCPCLSNPEGTSCTSPTSLDSRTCGALFGLVMVIVFMGCPCLLKPKGTSCTSLDSRTCDTGGALFGYCVHDHCFFAQPQITSWAGLRSQRGSRVRDTERTSEWIV